MNFLESLGRGFLKLLLWLVMVAAMVVLIVGGTAFYFYQQAGPEKLPSSAVSLGGVALEVNGYNWKLPILGGLINKRLTKLESLETQSLGSFDTAQPALTLPEGLREGDALLLTITDAGGAPVFSGDAAAFGQFQFTANGEYTGELRLTRPENKKDSYGNYYYRFKFSLNLRSQFSISASSAGQGDVIAVAVTGLPAGVRPTVETDLGSAWFVERYGRLVAFIPIAYNREAGDYAITATAGEYSETFTVKVLFVQYDKKHFDTSPTPTGAGADAAAEFQSKIWPLYQTADSAAHWEGAFQKPVDAPALSDYGWYETVGESTRPTRNSGITYSCFAGTAVTAPAPGRVVFAGQLGLTGGTVVIEHGAGLKSYLYQMSEVSVQEGQEVKAGDALGKTSSVLQYDLKIGNQSVDPNDALRGTSGIFWRG